ncbi:MAG: hypothetical protein ABSB35_18350 [Bryobacteraceae bacterium]
MLMGIISLSHWLSVMRKSGRKRMRRGTRLYFVWPRLSKRIAQASHAQYQFAANRLEQMLVIRR